MATSKINTNPFAVFQNPERREDWEDWEDEDNSDNDDALIDLHDEVSRPTRTRRKSRQRQRAKNNKAGIKVVTDMSQFRRSGTTRSTRAGNRLVLDERTGKFVDAAALRALEGSPTAASIGSLAWMKQKPGNNSGVKTANTHTGGHVSDLSPDARPIPIGIAVSSDSGAQQPRSVWSPDTEASESPYHRPRAASSIYSQYSISGAVPNSGNVPPVPTLPATLKFKQAQQAALVEDDDDDGGTPCTLFEEDGSPSNKRKSFRTRPGVAGSDGARSGWWDHNIASAVSQQSTNPFKNMPQQQTGSSTSQMPGEWWHGTDEKRQLAQNATGRTTATSAAQSQQNTAQASSSTSSSQSSRPQTHSEKAQILVEENQAPSEAPPPYSPPKSLGDVKYSGNFPAHIFNPQRIPSPGPISPGIAGTMSSQQGSISINLAEIPLTPRIVPPAVLPDRPVGAFAQTGDHFLDASGGSNKVERTRRRHEKEEAVARKVGGFWRGRGCIPDDGCFGRTGREGRRRRRIWLGVCGGILAAVILAVVLAVVFARKHLGASPSHAQSSSTPSEASAPAYWLNLTDFPPMPTGVFTVSGPNNSQAVSGCVNGPAKTAWSCSIPKDQQDVDSANWNGSNSPQFIFQIQYDNNTDALWKVEGEHDPGFIPNPAPPSLAEMAFLGNTTDGIVSSQKAGEPTPFYISLLSSPSAAHTLSGRDLGNGIDSAPDSGTNTTSSFNLTNLLPAPILTSSGKGAPARLYPIPAQQPARLFDRGLPTEHYGFYTYFTKTIYISDENSTNAADKNGGARLEDAHFVNMWSQTRFYVRLWTQKDHTVALLGNNGSTSDADQQPGTMPYPVTIGEDVHGGDRSRKANWWYAVNEDQTISSTNVSLIDVNRGFQGTLINPSESANLELGGVDGGSGGCKCEWVNFRGSS